MKSLKLYVLIVFGALILFSCKKDDDVTITPPRPYDEQYANEIIEIEEYLATHYLVGTGLDANIIEIPENGNQTPLSQHPNLTFKIVNKHDIEYKLYFLKLNEGVNERPSHVDSVFVTYKGWRFDGTQFDYVPNPVWFYHENLAVDGWTHFFPELKTGIYNESLNAFEDSGSGIVIIPSGLGYYNRTQTNIPAYSPLVFNIELNTLRYRDHDRDGIQSRFEVENLGDDPRKYDSDGDGVYNYLDIDDDGDGILTKKEIQRNSDGDLYPFDEIPACNGIKVHLDPACHGPILE